MNQSPGSSHLEPDMKLLSGGLIISADSEEPLPPTATITTVDRLISIREIRAMFGLGRTAAYELTHRPGFPAPVRISARCYRWWASDVTAFAASLQRQAQQVARQRSPHRAPHTQPVPAPRITGKVRMARRRTEAS